MQRHGKDIKEGQNYHKGEKEERKEGEVVDESGNGSWKVCERMVELIGLRGVRVEWDKL